LKWRNIPSAWLNSLKNARDNHLAAAEDIPSAAGLFLQHNGSRNCTPMTFKEKKHRDLPLDITPVVDIVFNLLIFFALTINFSTTASLDVKLPDISTRDAPPAELKATLEITSQGNMFINKVKTDTALLAGELQKLKRKEQKNNYDIIIQADASVSHGTVVTIMDICKKNGFSKISIAADIKQ